MGIFSIIFTSFTNCFGIAGIVFGALTISRGKKVHGIIIIVAAIIFALLGTVLGAMIAQVAGY